MTGFIRGLFGSKRKQGAGENANTAAKKPKAYFLDSDDAKTFGDIDYMKTAKSVKRTFPKTKTNQGEFSLTKNVSAMEDGSPNRETPPTFGQPVSTNNSAPQPTFKEEDKTDQRRRSDTSMDMFRNMARDIRKK
ncbi:MAG: hypothetical protein ACFE0J_06300 [Elainellaceae cyanobacterium]